MYGFVFLCHCAVSLSCCLVMHLMFSWHHSLYNPSCQFVMHKQLLIMVGLRFAYKLQLLGMQLLLIRVGLRFAYKLHLLGMQLLL